MKLEMRIKQIVIALIGNIVLGTGVALGSLPLLGADPSVSFSQAACVHLGVTIGQMITITNSVLLIASLILNRKNIGIATFIVVFLNQYPVDFVTNLVPRSEFLVFNILYIFVGCALIAIGCNIVIDSNLGKGIYDAFIFGIAEKINKSYVFSRYIVDGLFLLLTVLLKGYIGIGTIIPYLITGNLIKYTKPLVDKVFLVKEK